MLLAMAPPAGEGGQQQAPGLMIGWIVLMLAIFYFLMIRPQQRREKQRQAMLAAVKSGERVVFSGGMLGTVTNVKDKTLVIKIADNVKVEVVRSAVSRVLEKGENPEEEKK
jgi:preprotein translocase subunit YajC